MFVHGLTLSTIATFTGEELKWSMPVVVMVWVLAGLAGLIPVVRTIVLLVFALLLFPLWTALLFTVGVAGVLRFIEFLGRVMLTRPNAE